MSMASVNEVAAEINAHQRECAERYKGLENRLENADKRLGRLENMIWGIYLLLITSSLLPKFLP